MAQRRRSKEIAVGRVTVGGDAPIRVQSMCTTDTRDPVATIQQVYDLAARGCEIVRIAVPDKAAGEMVGAIKERSPVPLIADIHFDYRLALMALEGGVDGLRLNPGNITDAAKVKTVVQEAKRLRVPVRVGVNFGSLPRTPYKNLGPNPSTIDRMVDAALWEIGVLEELDFTDIKISMKAFDVPTMIGAYRTLAPLVPYPLHLGVTEAGPPPAGTIRSAVGIGTLLSEGIGDTIRVSLTADSILEVDAGFDILVCLNLRTHGPVMVACPSCGRAEIDVFGLAEQVTDHVRKLGYPLKVAVMGCVVNGPGEARDADIGIAGGKGRGVIFSKGEKLKVVEEKDFLAELMAEAERIIAERQKAEAAASGA